jgi:hypothetical protein
MTPFRPSSDGRANRIIGRQGRYCGFGGSWREFVEKSKVTFPMEGPNEALLIGARTPYPANGGGDWSVTKPRHWIFEGTGFGAETEFPA